MFLGSFAWSFVYLSLPFHIRDMSAWDAATTLRWTGWILGISPLLTVATAPLWGRMAGRGDARALYVWTQVLQGLAFLGMALARTLPELFVTRLVLGGVGAASTFAFIGAGRADNPREVRRRVAAVQAAMTMGQVLGPLAGAIAAARLGFRVSFVVGGLILFACGALAHWAFPDFGAPRQADRGRRGAGLARVAAVALIVLGGSTQFFFLTAILPQVLPDLGVPEARTLEIGGLVVFASSIAAALGSMAAPWLGELPHQRRLVGGLLAVSSVFIALLGAAESVWAYGTLRFLQVLFVSPVFPLVVARIAQSAGGEAIGIINSARIGASFVGPVLATSLLAVGTPGPLYLLLALLGLACVPLVAAGERRRQPRDGGYSV